MIGLLLICLLPGKYASGDEDVPQEEPFLQRTWDWVKGSRPKNALLLGMWSYHLPGTGVVGEGPTNEQNQLLGVLFYGFGAGTFINSHYDRSYFAGLSRTVYTKDFGKDARMDIGYQVGLLYGYGDNLPNIGGFCGYILPTVGFTVKRFGFDIGFVPVGIFTASFRIDIEGIFSRSKK
jgi:hypothetical protein